MSYGTAGVGLSALQAASEAIDTISNNIANSQTIGYKSGTAVFSDEFFRATDPSNPNRTGMGTSIQHIVRSQTNGTIVATSNPLDLAIGGLGMFTTANSLNTNGTPTNFQYTRNGQFGVDNQSRIVNENGNYLVGFPANPDGTINRAASSVLSLDQKPLPGAQTRSSTLAINLDDSQSPLDPLSTPFNPLNSSTYTQSTSQVIYDTTGVSHTLNLYYQKNPSIPLIITPDAAITLGSGSTANFQYNAKATTSIDANGNPISIQVATTADSEVQILQRTSITQPSSTSPTYLMTLADKSTLTVTGLNLSGLPEIDSALVTQFAVDTSRYSVYSTLDGHPVLNSVGNLSSGMPAGDANAYGAKALGTMAFVGGRNIDNLGGLAGGQHSSIGLTTTTSGATPNNVAFMIDTTGNSAYAGSNQTLVNSQDGAPLSQLSSYSFDNTGSLKAVYSNGQSKVMGQVQLAFFGDDAGLIPIGGNSYEASAISGDPTTGVAGEGLFGALKAQSLEQSNVDLTGQLVQLMTMQRQYSASSQVIKTSQTIQDEILQKLT